MFPLHVVLRRTPSLPAAAVAWWGGARRRGGGPNLLAGRAPRYVRDTGAWEPWLRYLSAGVAQAARQASTLINALRRLMQQAREQLRGYRCYSQELLRHLFRYACTKMERGLQSPRYGRATA